MRLLRGRFASEVDVDLAHVVQVLLNVAAAGRGALIDVQVLATQVKGCCTFHPTGVLPTRAVR